MRAILLGAAALGLAGCAEIRVSAETPTEITLCYDRVLVSRRDVVDRAQQHCAMRGLSAKTSIIGQCGIGLTEIVFTCGAIPPA